MNPSVFLFSEIFRWFYRWLPQKEWGHPWRCDLTVNRSVSHKQFLQDFHFFWAGVLACEWNASEKRELNPLELELQATVHNPGTELGSSANAVWALSHWEISPVLTALFLNVTVFPITNTISLKANWSFKYLGWIQALQWVQAGTETEMSWGLRKLFRRGTLSIHGAWFNTQYSKTPIPKKTTENNVLE